MPAGALKGKVEQDKRKLPEKIGDQAVYVRDLTNADLDAIDELTDDYAEIETQRDEILEQVKDAETPDERRELRGRARELAKQGRAMNTQMLGLYVETADREPFAHDDLHSLPVRVQTALITAATAILFPADHPTQDGKTATG